MCASAFLQAQSVASGPIVCFENCKIILQIKAEERRPDRSTSNYECTSILAHRQVQEQEQEGVLLVRAVEAWAKKKAI